MMFSASLRLDAVSSFRGSGNGVVFSGGRGKLGILLGLSRLSFAARWRSLRSMRARRALSSSEGLDHSPMLYIVDELSKSYPRTSFILPPHHPMSPLQSIHQWHPHRLWQRGFPPFQFLLALPNYPGLPCVVLKEQDRFLQKIQVTNVLKF